MFATLFISFLVLIVVLILLPFLPVWRIIWRQNGDRKWNVIHGSYGFLWFKKDIMYILQRGGGIQYGRSIVGINIPLITGIEEVNEVVFRPSDHPCWGVKNNWGLGGKKNVTSDKELETQRQSLYGKM